MPESDAKISTHTYICDIKVEGARTNTYKCLPTTIILLPWIILHSVGVFKPMW